MNMLSCVFPFPVFPTCLWLLTHFTTELLFPVYLFPWFYPHSCTASAPFSKQAVGSGSAGTWGFLEILEVVNIFFSPPHLIISMNDSNLVSVLAYAQAYFFLNLKMWTNGVFFSPYSVWQHIWNGSCSMIPLCCLWKRLFPVTWYSLQRSSFTWCAR